MAIRRRREPEITDYTDYGQPVQQPTRPRASSSEGSETLTYGKIVPQGRRGMREPRSLLEAMWYANPTSTTSQVVRPTNVLEPVGTSAARRAEANARVGMDADPVFDIYARPQRGGMVRNEFTLSPETPSIPMTTGFLSPTNELQATQTAGRFSTQNPFMQAESTAPPEPAQPSTQMADLSSPMNDQRRREEDTVFAAKGMVRVPGKGDPRVDNVPAKLAPGEAVLNAPAADMAGRGLIAALNKLGAQKMGMV